MKQYSIVSSVRVTKTQLDAFDKMARIVSAGTVKIPYLTKKDCERFLDFYYAIDAYIEVKK
jgi:hypothetical protein